MRGVLDYSDLPEVYEALKEAYPDIGKASYYDLAPGTHTVLYELTGKRLNWLWYVTQPEPELKVRPLYSPIRKRPVCQMPFSK